MVYTILQRQLLGKIGLPSAGLQQKAHHLQEHIGNYFSGTQQAFSLVAFPLATSHPLPAPKRAKLKLEFIQLHTVFGESRLEIRDRKKKENSQEQIVQKTCFKLKLSYLCLYVQHKMFIEDHIFTKKCYLLQFRAVSETCSSTWKFQFAKFPSICIYIWNLFTFHASTGFLQSKLLTLS